MTRTILLADDDADDFEIFGESLDELECACTLYRTQDGDGVLKFLADQSNPRPDVIFLDLNLPVMSGWQCLARVKSSVEHRDIPVVIYTTSSHYRDFEIARELDAYGLITKPSNPKILTEVLRRIVGALGTPNLRQAVKEAFLITQE